MEINLSRLVDIATHFNLCKHNFDIDTSYCRKCGVDAELLERLVNISWQEFEKKRFFTSPEYKEARGAFKKDSKFIQKLENGSWVHFGNIKKIDKLKSEE